MSRSPENIRINGAALRHIRHVTGLGVTGLAAEAGVTAAYISNLEAGRREAVSPAVYRRLLDALRITDRRTLMSDPVAIAS